MPYEPFFERFRELAWKETRSVTIFEKHPSLPPDDYGLIEMYCNDENCDCRRVFLSVASRRRNEYVAVIGYGWEDADFYQDWLGLDDPESIQELKGPALNLMSPQSSLAPALLDLISEVVLKDPAYIARLKRHYRMFKERVDPKHFRASGMAKRSVPAKTKSSKRRR